MSLSLSIQWNFAKIPLVKIEQNNKNPIYQNKNAFFFIFGGVVTRSAFYKMFTILREDFFFTPDSSCHKTPNRFFASLTIFFGDIWQTNYFFSIFWVFIHHQSKFGSFSLKIYREIICQSWPFQILFWPLFHSAMLTTKCISVLVVIIICAPAVHAR